MKAALIFTAISLTVSLSSVVQAKAFFGTIDKYLVVKTAQVIEVGSNDVEDGVATYYDYRTSKRKTIDLSELSKSTREEIAGVKAGERVLARTYVANSKTETVVRFCEVFYLFENKQAYIGCKATEADRINGYELPNRFDFIINNVEQVIAEVETLDGFKTNEIAELRVDTENLKAGKNVRVLAIFTNGEALIQKAGFSVLDTSGVLNKLGAVEKIKLTDLNKL